MKKVIAAVCAMAVSMPVALADEDISVYLNDTKMEFDQPPIILNNRTMVPMRVIFEQLGLAVQWFDEGNEQRVTAFNGNVNITMFIENSTIYINEEPFEMDAAPTIRNGRTLIPVRFISEILGAVVDWYPESRTVTINTDTDEYRFNTTPDEDLLYEVFDLTNKEREKHNLKPLVWNDELAAVAKAHCLDMAERDFFNHVNPDGKTPFDRIKAAGMDYFVAAENIAAGQGSPEEVINGWMQSQGHRENILNPNLKELGVGIARGGEYGIYWTQNFITLRDK